MKQDKLADKNLDLFHEFMMYALENPEILDRIPKGAHLVIIPEDDPNICMKNLEILHKRKEEGQTVVTVKMLTPKRIVPKIAVS